MADNNLDNVFTLSSTLRFTFVALRSMLMPTTGITWLDLLKHAPFDKCSKGTSHTAHFLEFRGRQFQFFEFSAGRGPLSEQAPLEKILPRFLRTF